jgi:hypothetical protein
MSEPVERRDPSVPELADLLAIVSDILREEASASEASGAAIEEFIVAAPNLDLPAVAKDLQHFDLLSQKLTNLAQVLSAISRHASSIPLPDDGWRAAMDEALREISLSDLHRRLEGRSVASRPGGEADDPADIDLWDTADTPARG